ncbi:MAG TPA: sulfatase-like hydrolase/transferase [Verrucomicrobiae bacterium]|nr:sulfatase-like hydrolase/transferase [Verrucomicrobiae bacterium]
MSSRLSRWLAVLLFMLFAGAAGAAAPNILFILTDDLGYGDLGVFFQNARAAHHNRSEPWHLTPRIDKLAAGGVQLPQYYCPAPVCAPSRASLMLGVSQGHANVRDNQFDKALENNHTVASVLKRAGYATVIIGKWGLQGLGGHSPAEWPAYPTKRGFDDFFGYVRHSDGHEHYPKEGIYRKPKEVWDNDREISSELDKCYTTDLFTARAKQWIIDHEHARAGQPFFMYLAYDTPHAVIELPTQAYPKGGGLKGGLRWLGTPGHMINTASGVIDSYYYRDYVDATWDNDHNPSTAEVAWPDVYKRYASVVRRIDDCVGDLVTLLDQLNIATNTLVIFTSDNGPSRESYLPQAYEPTFFGGYGPFDGIKRDDWEGGIRVGAIARWTGRIPAGRTSALPCSGYDWMATFAELAGVPAPARTDGVSLVPALTGEGKQRPPTVYVEYFHGGKTPDYQQFAPAHRNRVRKQMQSLRIGDYQGVRYNIKAPDAPFEIYDVVKDPQETKNLAARPEFTSLQKQMQARVLELRRPDPGAHRPYDSKPIPASPAEPGGEVGYAVFQGTWPWVPDFASMTPLRSGKTKTLDLSVRPRDDNFGIAFNGSVTVPADGEYTFYLKSDSGALLRLHDATVIDDDFNHDGSEKSGSIRLKAGAHPFRLYYRHATGNRVLDVEYSGPGVERKKL